MRIIHPPEINPARQPGKEQGEEAAGRRFLRAVHPCQASPGLCRETGRRGHAWDCTGIGCHLLSSARDRPSAALGACFPRTVRQALAPKPTTTITTSTAQGGRLNKLKGISVWLRGSKWLTYLLTAIHSWINEEALTGINSCPHVPQGTGIGAVLMS